ncbi:MAG TPA: formylmethanofuran dehydrogenase [Nitrospiraceae bacterium]|nr:formylmethanofuran dehydrogenase [Nitrospiraceae bacterium]
MPSDQETDLRDAIQFHGHLCPGLALGYRVAKAALRELKAERPHDEELVALVENDSCAADAIQFITGCTFGKGNFVFRDFGKHVYTFYNRKTGEGIRIAEDYRGYENDPRYPELKKRQEAGEDVSKEFQQYKMDKAAAILRADDAEIFRIERAATPAPEEAKIRASLRCSRCGEKFMESRGRMNNGVVVCIPCSEKG